jgi:ABC-type transport system involved in cytochrome bd biosynthesis fused ATPase/permease subunit
LEIDSVWSYSSQKLLIQPFLFPKDLPTFHIILICFTTILHHIHQPREAKFVVVVVVVVVAAVVAAIVGVVVALFLILCCLFATHGSSLHHQKVFEFGIHGENALAFDILEVIFDFKLQDKYFLKSNFYSNVVSKNKHL